MERDSIIQTCIDTQTGQLYAIDDDVVVAVVGGAYLSFASVNGTPLGGFPAALRPDVAPELTAAQIAAQQAVVAQATLAGQANAALLADLAIVSSGSPPINGTYACDQLSQMDIIAIETSLNAGRGFPGGATAFNYPDVTGAAHSFSEANFTDFAAAVRDYLYALKSVIAGASSAMPSASTTIA